MSSRNYLMVVSAAVVALSVVGCSGDSGSSTPATETRTSSLRVIHMSPSAPAVDVYVNGQTRVFSNLSFLESTEYLEVASGTDTFNIVPAGAEPSASVLDVANLTLGADRHYTVVAFGELESLQAIALEDDIADIERDTLRVRAIHTAPGVGQVDIWSIPELDAPAPLYEDVDFGAAGDALDLPPGAHTIGFDVDNDRTPDLTFDLPALDGGILANVFAVNDSDGNVFLNAQLPTGVTARIDARVEAPGTTEIRVVHLSPDAPPVDIWLDGAGPVIAELPFGEGSDYLELEEGLYSFSVSPADTSAEDSVLDIENLALMAGTQYTAVAFNALSSIQALALLDDTANLEDGNIRVRPIHTAAGVGQVDIWNLPGDMSAPSLLYADVDFAAVGDYLDLPAGAYTLGFDVDDDGAPDAIFETPALPAGTVANLFAVTDGQGELSVRAQLAGSSIATILPTVASVRLLHLSPDAPAVDVLVNMDEATRPVMSLPFGEGTNYVEVVPGEYSFEVTPAGGGAGDSVLEIPARTLEGDSFYTAVAFDLLSEIKGLWLEDDYTAIPAGSFRVRAIHAASAVGQVDIWNIPADMSPPSPLYQDVDFGVAGGYLDLPAGAYTLGFDATDDGNPDLIFDLPPLPAGAKINAFAVSDSSGDVYLLAQFADGTTARIDHR